jgi:hypothetical protein
MSNNLRGARVKLPSYVKNNYINYDLPKNTNGKYNSLITNFSIKSMLCRLDKNLLEVSVDLYYSTNPNTPFPEFFNDKNLQFFGSVTLDIPNRDIITTIGTPIYETIINLETLQNLILRTATKNLSTDLILVTKDTKPYVSYIKTQSTNYFFYQFKTNGDYAIKILNDTDDLQIFMIGPGGDGGIAYVNVDNGNSIYKIVLQNNQMNDYCLGKISDSFHF